MVIYFQSKFGNRQSISEILANFSFFFSFFFCCARIKSRENLVGQVFAERRVPSDLRLQERESLSDERRHGQNRVLHGFAEEHGGGHERRSLHAERAGDLGVDRSGLHRQITLSGAQVFVQRVVQFRDALEVQVAHRVSILRSMLLLLHPHLYIHKRNISVSWHSVKVTPL